MLIVTFVTFALLNLLPGDVMVQGAVTLIAVGFVLVNFAIDTLYSVLDPRVAR